MSKQANQSNLAKDLSLSKLREELGAQNQQIKRLMSEKADLTETITQLRDEVTREKEENSQSKEEFRQTEEQKGVIIAQKDQLQSRVKELERQLQERSAKQIQAEDDTKRQLDELQRQVSSYRVEIEGYEGRIAGLSEELDWYKDNRERMKKEWDERTAMELKWRDDLQVLISNNNINNMSPEARRRAALEAPDPIQQAAQRAAPRGAAPRAAAPRGGRGGKASG